MSQIHPKPKAPDLAYLCDPEIRKVAKDLHNELMWRKAAQTTQAILNTFKPRGDPKDVEWLD